MANFELRIYVIDQYTYEDVKANTDPTATGELDDETFIELCEERGGVYSLNGFLSKETHDTIDLTENVFRAYFIQVDDGNSAPIRADHYYTVISANKISYDFGNKDDEQVLYLELNKPNTSFVTEVKHPESKLYTIIVRNNGDNSTDEIVELIENLDDVLDVEIIEEHDENNYQCIRFQVETETYFDYDVLEGTIDNYGGLDCEFIDREDNY